jgi:calcineurin-like phosphoesterase
MDREIILRRFLTLLPERFEVAGGPGVICGVVIDIEEREGNATHAQRVFWNDLT